MKVYRFRDIYVYVMYYVYVTSGPSLLIESTDSMINHNYVAQIFNFNENSTNSIIIIQSALIYTDSKQFENLHK